MKSKFIKRVAIFVSTGLLSATLGYVYLWEGLTRPTRNISIQIPEVKGNNDWIDWPTKELSQQLRAHPFASSFKMSRTYLPGGNEYDGTAEYSRSKKVLYISEILYDSKTAAEEHRTYRNITDRMIHRLAENDMSIEYCQLEGCTPPNRTD